MKQLVTGDGVVLAQFDPVGLARGDLPQPMDAGGRLPEAEQFPDIDPVLVEDIEHRLPALYHVIDLPGCHGVVPGYFPGRSFERGGGGQKPE